MQANSSINNLVAHSLSLTVYNSSLKINFPLEMTPVPDCCAQFNGKKFIFLTRFTSRCLFFKHTFFMKQDLETVILLVKENKTKILRKIFFFFFIKHVLH